MSLLKGPGSTKGAKKKVRQRVGVAKVESADAAQVPPLMDHLEAVARTEVELNGNGNENGNGSVETEDGGFHPMKAAKAVKQCLPCLGNAMFSPTFEPSFNDSNSLMSGLFPFG